jgi:hypothetical protein
MLGLISLAKTVGFGLVFAKIARNDKKSSVTE